MDKGMLALTVWLLSLGGVFGFGVGILKFFGGGTPMEYGVMGIGGGFYLLASAPVIQIKNRS